jgi:radical SAM superfamily enzyme YgiQ (UPF0313 family)
MIWRGEGNNLLVGAKRALLINPPIYDTQYWAHWSQPHGLLKVATWLRNQGYDNLRLLDCLATNGKRKVTFRKRNIIQRDNINRQLCEYGWPLAKLEKELCKHAQGELFYPEEIWITSIMTYWWESTRDVIRLVKKCFPQHTPRILVGGIYPTLAPEHAEASLSGESENIIIVPGEICPEAANSWTDLSLYNDPVYDYQPRYAIITGSRGCPFNCAYCAQLKLNNGTRKLRHRTSNDITEEIIQKYKVFGIREFAFYEDNLLFNKDEFIARLDAIEQLDLKLEFYAPEGIEPRLIEDDLLTKMRKVGFQKIHLALETIDDEIAKSWNRRQATIEKFDRAVDIAQRCGFRAGAQELNAFVIFGIPDEDLQAVVNTAIYASHRVGSVVPMLFTPVPGSLLYDKHNEYLMSQGWHLHDFNGKLLPFLEYNQTKYPGLHASDYLELETLMMRLNSSKVYSKRFDILGESKVSETFREVVAQL